MSRARLVRLVEVRIDTSRRRIPRVPRIPMWRHSGLGVSSVGSPRLTTCTWWWSWPCSATPLWRAGSTRWSWAHNLESARGSAFVTLAILLGLRHLL